MEGKIEVDAKERKGGIPGADLSSNQQQQAFVRHLRLQQAKSTPCQQQKLRENGLKHCAEAAAKHAPAAPAARFHHPGRDHSLRCCS
jgi:hypothetical protein